MLAFLVFPLAVPGNAFAYRVNGVVEFSYMENRFKVGDTLTSDHVWTQTYRVNLQNYFLDPRAMTYNVDIGYSTFNHATGQDSRSLDYGLDATFFPGMKVSGDAFARNNSTTVQSESNIAGYEFRSKSYGATMNIALGGGGNTAVNNNNNNNSNSDNSARRTRFFSLPDLSLSRTHTDNNSFNAASPLHETLDITRASANSRMQALGDISLNVQQDEFRNLTDSSSYDAKTADIISNLEVSPEATAAIVGRYTDRTVNNIAGFASWNRTWGANARLDFKEKDRFKHNYQYGFTKQGATGFDSTSQSVLAAANYSLSDAVIAQGSINYTTSEYVTRSSTSVPVTSKSTADSSSAAAGITYQKMHTPAFLNPFVANTHYGFNLGYTSYSGVGSGFSYGNDIGLGLMSTGWQLENLSIDLSYQNARDLSPAHHDLDVQSYRMNFTSRRVERTTIKASITYTEQYIRSAATLTQFTATQTANTSMKSLLYEVNADHAVTNHLNVTAGASRGETKSSQYASISQLQASTVSSTDDQIYLAANFSYPLSRYLNYSANARTEYHHTQTTRTQIEDVSMKLDYRIRMVFIGTEARLRTEKPEGSARTEQQYYFVKLTRPF